MLLILPYIILSIIFTHYSLFIPMPSPIILNYFLNFIVSFVKLRIADIIGSIQILETVVSDLETNSELMNKNHIKMNHLDLDNYDWGFP